MFTTDPRGRATVPTFQTKTLREVNCLQQLRTTDSPASPGHWRQGHGKGRGLAAPVVPEGNRAPVKTPSRGPLFSGF